MFCDDEGGHGGLHVRFFFGRGLKMEFKSAVVRGSILDICRSAFIVREGYRSTGQRVALAMCRGMT